MIHSILLVGQSNMAGRGFVSAVGLGSNPDKLHFNAAALRQFGERYYEMFLTLEDKGRVYPEKSAEDAAIRTAMELL